jgi:vacuolar-type H+-ATPase subunit I/STV1
MKNDPASLVGVVATNVVAIAIAWWQHWPLVTLLWPYWIQSVIIGWYSRERILALKQFSLANTEGFDKGSDEATRRQTARFFTLHYGAFHLVYALFLWTLTTRGMHGVRPYPISALDLLFMAAITVSFVLTHRATYQRIMAADRQGRPNIGGVMFLPYLRILPMHLTIILGATAGHPGGVLLFGGLKTVADALMHWIEYRITTRAVESPA